MTVRDKPNFNRPNAPILFTKINTEDREIFNVQNVKDKAVYNERLYNELLAQLDENPLVNNIETTSKYK